jgi:hypothetical protein
VQNSVDLVAEWKGFTLISCWFSGALPTHDYVVSSVGVEMKDPCPIVDIDIAGANAQCVAGVPADSEAAAAQPPSSSAPFGVASGYVPSADVEASPQYGLSTEDGESSQNGASDQYRGSFEGEDVTRRHVSSQFVISSVSEGLSDQKVPSQSGISTEDGEPSQDGASDQYRGSFEGEDVTRHDASSQFAISSVSEGFPDEK